MHYLFFVLSIFSPISNQTALQFNRWSIFIVTEDHKSQDILERANSRRVYDFDIVDNTNYVLSGPKKWVCRVSSDSHGSVIKVKCTKDELSLFLLCEGSYPRALAHCFTELDTADSITIRTMELPGKTLY